MVNFIQKYFKTGVTCSIAGQIEFTQKMLNFWGLRILHNDREHPMLWERILSTFSCYAIFFIICTCINYIRLYPEQVNEVINGLTAIVTGFNGYPKMYCYIGLRADFKKILKKTLMLSESWDHEEKTIRDIGLKYQKLTCRVVLSIFLFYSGSIFMYTIFPYILMIFTDAKWVLVGGIKLPFIDIVGYIGYSTHIIYSYIAFFFAICVLFGFHVIFYSIAIHIACRYEILHYYIDFIGNKNSVYDTDEKQHQLIMKCVRMHSSIYKFFIKCANMFKLALLLELLTATGQICMCLMHARLSVVNNSYIMLITEITLIFYYSFCGELVLEKANGVRTHLIHSNWYQLKSIRDKRLLIFMLMNVNTNVGFSAGGFSTISMETFTLIMKQAFSFSAVLMNVL